MPNGYALMCVQTPPFFLPKMCARMGNPPNYTHPVSLGDIPRGPNVVPGTSTGLRGGCRGVQLKARAMSTSVRKRQPNHPGRKGPGGLADSFSLKERRNIFDSFKKKRVCKSGALLGLLKIGRGQDLRFLVVKSHKSLSQGLVKSERPPPRGGKMLGQALCQGPCPPRKQAVEQQNCPLTGQLAPEASAQAEVEPK